MATLARRAVGKLKRWVFPEPVPTAVEPAPATIAPPPVPLRNPYPIRLADRSSASTVDQYWSDYTIRSAPYATAQDTLDFLQWRSDHFHLSYEFKGFWADHQGQTLLDYGCGPGHDLMGFLVYSKAAKVYGVDISAKALALAGHNVGLHGIAADRVELVQTADLNDRIPLADASVDYVHSCGVVHHTSRPDGILREFNRVLRPGGNGLIMVYNRSSLFFHLYVAYVRLVLDPAFAGQTPEQVFVQSTDGPECPVSRCYEADEFSAHCRDAGFECEYVGGFVASNELDLWAMHGRQALADPRLTEPHRSFLSALAWDERGLPLSNGKYAGIGGTYRLKKRG